MSNINKILEFISLTHKFQQVIRTIYATGENRDENDAEHSYQLALLGWYLIESEHLNLDTTKVMQYAMVHDLVEIYAGDTYFYTTDQKLKDSKADREKAAAEKLKQEFPEFPSMYQLIANYEDKADPESKFVYVLDKIIPVLNIYTDKGRSWQRDHVTYDMLVSMKEGKVAISADAEPVWKELKELLDQHKDYFYPDHK